MAVDGCELLVLLSQHAWWNENSQVKMPQQSRSSVKKCDPALGYLF